MSDAPLVLYDGACGLCARGVQFILDHESAPTLRFAPLQSELGRRIIAEHGLAGQDTMIYAEGGQAWIRSDGALRIAAHLRAPWRWLGVLRIIPGFLRDWIYRFVASTRTNWPAKACRIPDAATRARFIG